MPTHARLLTDPRAALSARIDLIRSARHEIQLNTHWFKNDLVGRTLIAELTAAARTGVRVRLLIDDVSRKPLSPVALAYLIDAGIEVGFYNPTMSFRPRRTYRMHDKLLIVDRAQVVMGGRNTDDGYFGLAPTTAQQYTDVDIAASGDLAREASRYGDAMWSGGLVQRARRPVGVADDALRAYAALLGRPGGKRSQLEHLRSAWRRQPAVELDDVEFVHEEAASLRNTKRAVHQRILRLIDEARTEVEIHNAYMVPTADFLAAVTRATARGVKVTIVTNSPTSAVDRLPNIAFQTQLPALARAGATVWQLRGRRMMHEKVVIVDRSRVLIGSFNIDPRSRDLNKEVAMVAHVPAFAAALLERGQAYRKVADPSSADGRLVRGARPGLGWALSRPLRSGLGVLLRVSGLYGQI